jgi:hypothetical protein
MNFQYIVLICNLAASESINNGECCCVGSGKVESRWVKDWKRFTKIEVYSELNLDTLGFIVLVVVVVVVVVIVV